ncbi:MAG TPA: serine hydrolase [Chloroflexota bacterium]|nr:serine hydrolase [Chloroflexota bacterium]
MRRWLTLAVVAFVAGAIWTHRPATPKAAAAALPAVSGASLHLVSSSTAVAGSLVRASAPASVAPADVPADAARILNAIGGDDALIIQAPGSQPVVSINPDAILPSASLYKLGVMAAIYQGAAAKSISLDEQITITQDEVDFYGDAPATAAGTTLTLREALRRMIQVSDNSAAGALIDLVGYDAVNAAFSANGMPHSHLGNPPDSDQRSEAETTAADQAAFFNRLLNGKVVGPTASGEMLTTLEGQQENDRLPAMLPPGTTVAHKTGELDGVRNDSGIIFTPNGPIIVTVLVSNQPEVAGTLNGEAQIGLLAFQALPPR